VAGITFSVLFFLGSLRFPAKSAAASDRSFLTGDEGRPGDPGHCLTNREPFSESSLGPFPQADLGIRWQISFVEPDGGGQAGEEL